MATQAEKISGMEPAGASRYHVEIDETSDTTHATILRLVGRDKRVLELGCASGHMSAHLREHGCRVTAVELDPVAAESAAIFCDRVVVGDLDQQSLEQELAGETFDVAIAADVLEHLKDPLAVLRSLRDYLRPDGYVVVSVPNVAHLSVRLALLSGRFPYGETGLLDRTHLRFFTRESLEKLFDDAGFAIGHFQRVEAVAPNPAGFEVPYDPAAVPPAVLEALAQDPEASTYQFVVVAYPLPRTELALIQERHRRLALELEELRRQNREYREQVDHLSELRVHEMAETTERSQAMINDLQLQLQQGQRTREEEAARGARELATVQQNERILLEETANLQQLLLAARNRATELQNDFDSLREQAAGNEEKVSTASVEAAILHETITGQNAENERLKARVETLFSRERDLREMLIEAHDQLLRRDEEIAANLGSVLAPAPVAQAPSVVQSSPAAPIPATPRPLPGTYLQYQQLLHRIRELVREAIPQGGRVLVVSKGDDDLLRLEPCSASHFPQSRGGLYAGHHPADSGVAIGHLEDLHESGAEFLLIPQTSLWWLDHYREFYDHLHRHYLRLIDQPEAMMFALNRRPEGSQGSLAPAVVIPVPQKAPFGVNVSGHITSEKGVGEAVRATIRGLNSAGIPVALNDYPDGGSVNLDTEFVHFAPDNPYAVNLIQANADSLPGFLEWKSKDYLRNRYNIGYWFWETETFPRGWWDRFQHLDEVWVGTEFVLDAVSRVSPVPVVKIPVTLPDRLLMRPRTRAYFGLPDDSFVFVFIFDYMSIAQRKNPLGTIQAFREAFRKKDKAVLVLKTGHANACPEEARRVAAACGDANIKIINDVLPREDVNSLMQLADCYVSLHRSEGFGLTIAEAMSLEKPVIATAYSGNMDFMTPANSYLVKFKLAEIGKGCEPYADGVWADPDVHHAAELMRRVFRKRDEGLQIGRTARMDILRALNPERAGALMRDRILRLAELGKIEGPSEELAAPSKTKRRNSSYPRLVQSIVNTVNRELPSGARVLVVSKGDDELLRFRKAIGWHYPQTEDGLYAGSYPSSGADAIGHLEMLREKGADYLIFPQTSFWWLDHYAELRSHLESRYKRIWSDHNSLVYKLRSRRSRRK